VGWGEGGRGVTRVLLAGFIEKKQPLQDTLPPNASWPAPKDELNASWPAPKDELRLPK
jgi:hypothetical protein